jgi:hypothetical protein
VSDLDIQDVMVMESGSKNVKVKASVSKNESLTLISNMKVVNVSGGERSSSPYSIYTTTTPRACP